MILKSIIVTLLSSYSILCWGYPEDALSSNEHHYTTRVDKAKELTFTSSDKKLEATFDWGKKVALSYAHNGNDPVGFWYEAAYMGKMDELTINGKQQKTKSRTDLMGNIISYIEIDLTPGTETQVNIK